MKKERTQVSIKFDRIVGRQCTRQATKIANYWQAEFTERVCTQHANKLKRQHGRLVSFEDIEAEVNDGP